MGVRITDAGNVALYDSTSGMAFGPIFRDEYEAEDFLAWMKYRSERGDVGHEDPRVLDEGQLIHAVHRFKDDAEAWGNVETDLSLTDWLVAKENEGSDKQ